MDRPLELQRQVARDGGSFGASAQATHVSSVWIDRRGADGFCRENGGEPIPALRGERAIIFAFDEAVALLHSFFYEEARRRFEALARLDPALENAAVYRARSRFRRGADVERLIETLRAAGLQNA